MHSRSTARPSTVDPEPSARRFAACFSARFCRNALRGAFPVPVALPYKLSFIPSKSDAA